MSNIQDRIKAAIKRICDGHACMSVPVRDTDPDIVLANAGQEIERFTAELEQVRAELGEAQRLIKNLAPTGKYNGVDIEGWYLRAQSAESLLSRAQDTIQVLTQQAETAETKNASLAAQVAVMEVALQYYANGGHYEIETPESPITLLDGGEVAEKALATAPAKAEKLVRVVEAVKEYDTAISTLEKDHGRKDMELTQHSKLIPVRELSRDL